MKTQKWLSLISLVLITLLLGGCSENESQDLEEEPSPERWSEVKMGMTFSEVENIMGPPDEVYTIDKDLGKIHIDIIYVYCYEMTVTSINSVIGLENSVVVYIRQPGPTSRWLHEMGFTFCQ